MRVIAQSLSCLASSVSGSVRGIHWADYVWDMTNGSGVNPLEFFDFFLTDCFLSVRV